MRHGWLKIDGLQSGDRTLEEQIEALKPALAECKGKTVVDLGCAEGLISLEFAKAGALRVLGIDAVPEHLDVARVVCKGYDIKFKYWNIERASPASPLSQYDIVLALGIIHKLSFPEIGLRWAAMAARELLLLRCGRGMVNGIITGKKSRITGNAHKVLTEEGFRLDRVVTGPPPHSEDVEYWRR